MRKLVVALAGGLAVCAAAQAQTQTPSMQAPHYYLGLGAATADHVIDVAGLSNVDPGDYRTSLKVFGGADFDPIWGVELGYTDFRGTDFSYTANGVPGTGSTNGYAFYLAGKGRWPIHQQAEVFGKLGLAHSRREFDSSLPLGVDDSNNDTGIYAGVGLQWNINPQWALTAEYERYGKEKDIGAKADVWTVAARYNF